MLEPIRRVRFTRAALRHANIRESEGPSLAKVQVTIPHQRSPYAVKFEDSSPEETARQERCARGEATVYVRELDLFVTVMLLENTPAVLSLGKLVKNLYSYHWTRGQKPHLIKNGKNFNCDTSNHVPFVV